MSWFRRRSAEVAKPAHGEPAGTEDDAATADGLAAAAFEDSPAADDGLASPFEAAWAELAREQTAADAQRDAEDRAWLEQIAERGSAVDQASKALYNRYWRTFARRLSKLGLGEDDQALLINGLFFDLCMTLTKDKQPIRCPADRVPLAWLRVALMNRTRNWFKEQQRAGDRVELARAQLSPHLFEYQSAGQHASEHARLDVEPHAREPYSLERRPDDPTFDLAGARLILLQVRDLIDRLRCSEPRRLKDIELLEAVWSGELNGLEVAQYRWQVCLKACELRCVQVDCKEGGEDAGRQALSRARAWLKPLIRHLL